MVVMPSVAKNEEALDFLRIQKFSQLPSPDLVLLDVGVPDVEAVGAARVGVVVVLGVLGVLGVLE